MLKKFIVIILAVSFIVVGCGKTQNPVSNQNTETSNSPKIENQDQAVSNESQPKTASDIAGNFFEKSIQRLIDKDVVELKDGKFYPNNTITRAEFITWLAKAFDKGLPPVNPPKPTYPDLDKNHPAYTTIETLTNNGMLVGFKDGTMQPDKAITREEATVIWSHYHKAGLVAKEAAYAGLKSYTDRDAMNKDYAPEIAAAHTAMCRVLGETLLFRPKEPLTRAEAAAMMNDEHEKYRGIY